jgi:hypothetical protein
MIPLAAATAPKADANPWLASIYAGIFTAILAVIATMLFSADQLPIPSLVFHLLAGAGPVLGYQMATGQLVRWGSVIGGILGSILPILGWPLLVGALTSTQSIGKLIGAALLGTILGWAVVLLIASPMGQDPNWVNFGYVIGSAVWGGTCGALMTAWAKR